ncbi:uncharacterized protein LOC117642282 [Thrips palmi]|uniref:Uncharacterized protein LOC117642282 n=1 Tax=Thrips palmi TaxID=161013 RepID=A0A6P8YQ21_THRPL|nr:uncharacterized protein LOC117642282 [Thrips palmi]
MAPSTAHLRAAAVLSVFLIARVSGQHWQQGGAYDGGQGQWFPPYSQQPWTAPSSVSWGPPTPSFAAGQSDAAWGWSPNFQNDLHHQHGHHGQHDPHAQYASYEYHGQHGHHGHHGHDLPVAQPSPHFSRGWAPNAAPGWCSMTPQQQAWHHQPSHHQPSTPSSGWDASWDIGMGPFASGARWARSSSQQQAPVWLRDPSVPRPLGTVLLDGGIRVSVRDFRHILEHYKTGAWRDVTTDTGAKMLSETFDEFERSASKFAVQVPLANGAVVPALTYCLVVRCVTDDKTHAVLEVPDGSTCPLRQLADRADVASWMHALFPEGLRPRQHHGTPHVWAPAAATTSTTATPPPDATTTCPPPPATTPRPPVQDAKESTVAEQEKSASTQNAGHAYPPLQGHAHGNQVQQQGHQRHHQAPRGQRLPVIWSPGLAPGSVAPSNSIDHIVQPHSGGFAN